jgi:Na+/melibiose symporter-like transporter
MEGWFKAAPKLPENGKEGLAKAFPWIALIFGVLQLWAAWGLWVVYDRADRVLDLFSVYYDVGYTGMDRTMIFVGIAVLAIDAVILLMAWPKLSKRERGGWDLLYLGALLNLVYAVVSLFIDNRGVGSFIFSLIGSAIGFWLLFQVREKFGGKPAAPKAPEPPKEG